MFIGNKKIKKMIFNRNFIALLLFSSLFLVSCIKDEFDTGSKELTNAEIMNKLKIGDLSVLNTLTTQRINLSTLKLSDLKDGQSMQEYPNGDKYYFALFEDLYPYQGDYDFNDIIIKSKLGLEYKGDEITGYLKSELVNKGGSLPIEVGLMFYEVSNKKLYIRIPNENITVNGMQLIEGEGPWTIPYAKLGKGWTINFGFKTEAKDVWIAYHIVTVRGEKRTEILTGGFAKTDVTPFKIPNKDFLNKNGFPWGLEIEAEKFAIPNEKVLFLKAYPEFQKWVESGGAEAGNWFESPDPNYTHY